MKEKELFVWNSLYELGIEAIDIQHKRWLGIMNKLYNSFVNKDSKETILDVLREMKEYTVYHFSTEERYFKQYGYQESVEHKKLHTDFIEELDKFHKEYALQPSALTYKVMNFMQSWLTNHIMKSDKQYVNLLKNKI